MEAEQVVDIAYLYERAFLENIERLRKEHKWTKTQLAKKAFGKSKGAQYRAYCRLLQVKKKKSLRD